MSLETHREGAYASGLDLAAMVLDVCQLGLILLDKDRHVMFWNDWMGRHSSVSPGEAMGKTLDELFPELTDTRILRAVEQALKKGNSALISHTLNKNPFPLKSSPGDGETIKQSIYISPIRTAPETRGCLIQIMDVTASTKRERLLRKKTQEADESRLAAEKANQQLATVNRELQQLSTTDALTGVDNRRSYDKYLERVWQATQREGLCLSVILIDIDYFKQFNDSYGHPAGDVCLKQVASALKQAVQRPMDMVGRYGGEEFVVLLPRTDASGANIVAERMRKAVEGLAILHDKSTIGDYVTASLGTATSHPDKSLSPTALVTMADRALYMAKSAGRNRCINAADI